MAGRGAQSQCRSSYVAAHLLKCTLLLLFAQGVVCSQADQRSSVAAASSASTGSRTEAASAHTRSDASLTFFAALDAHARSLLGKSRHRELLREDVNEEEGGNGAGDEEREASATFSPKMTLALLEASTLLEGSNVEFAVVYETLLSLLRDGSPSSDYSDGVDLLVPSEHLSEVVPALSKGARHLEFEWATPCLLKVNSPNWGPLQVSRFDTSPEASSAEGKRLGCIHSRHHALVLEDVFPSVEYKPSGMPVSVRVPHNPTGHMSFIFGDMWAAGLLASTPPQNASILFEASCSQTCQKATPPPPRPQQPAVSQLSTQSLPKTEIISKDLPAHDGTKRSAPVLRSLSSLLLGLGPPRSADIVTSSVVAPAAPPSPLSVELGQVALMSEETLPCIVLVILVVITSAWLSATTQLWPTKPSMRMLSPLGDPSLPRSHADALLVLVVAAVSAHSVWSASQIAHQPAEVSVMVVLLVSTARASLAVSLLGWQGVSLRTVLSELRQMDSHLVLPRWLLLALPACMGVAFDLLSFAATHALPMLSFQLCDGSARAVVQIFASPALAAPWRQAPAKRPWLAASTLVLAGFLALFATDAVHIGAALEMEAYVLGLLMIVGRCALAYGCVAYCSCYLPEQQQQTSSSDDISFAATAVLGMAFNFLSLMLLLVYGSATHAAWAVGFRPAAALCSPAVMRAVMSYVLAGVIRRSCTKEFTASLLELQASVVVLFLCTFGGCLWAGSNFMWTGALATLTILAGSALAAVSAVDADKRVRRDVQKMGAT